MANPPEMLPGDTAVQVNADPVQLKYVLATVGAATNVVVFAPD